MRVAAGAHHRMARRRGVQEAMSASATSATSSWSCEQEVVHSHGPWSLVAARWRWLLPPCSMKCL
jgi:hypothetical protein